MAKPVNEIPALYFAKKRRNHYYREYQQEKANKDQKGITGKNYLYKPIYIMHIKGRI